MKLGYKTIDEVVGLAIVKGVQNIKADREAKEKKPRAGR